MATAVFSPSFSFAPVMPRAPRMVSKPPRRQPTSEQGRALSILTHAIEYLVDARLPDGGTSDSDNQAVRLMMSASRAVFEECPVAVPLKQKVSGWFAGKPGRSYSAVR